MNKAEGASCMSPIKLRKFVKATADRTVSDPINWHAKFDQLAAHPKHSLASAVSPITCYFQNWSNWFILQMNSSCCWPQYIKIYQYSFIKFLNQKSTQYWRENPLIVQWLQLVALVSASKQFILFNCSSSSQPIVSGQRPYKKQQVTTYKG